MLARAANVTEEEMRDRLDAATAPMLDDVVLRTIVERESSAPEAERPNVAPTVRREMRTLWRDPRKRQQVCPPKEILGALNAQLESESRKAITFQRLARIIRAEDVADELQVLFAQIEGRET